MKNKVTEIVTYRELSFMTVLGFAVLVCHRYLYEVCSGAILKHQLPSVLRGTVTKISRDHNFYQKPLLINDSLFNQTKAIFNFLNTLVIVLHRNSSRSSMKS